MRRQHNTSYTSLILKQLYQRSYATVNGNPQASTFPHNSVDVKRFTPTQKRRERALRRVEVAA